MNKPIIRCLFLIITFISLKGYVLSQTFTGSSTDKQKGYSCAMKINPDSSVIFIYKTTGNKTYAHYSGIVKRMNDTLFHIVANMVFGKFDVRSLYVTDIKTNETNDTDYFYIDTAVIKFFNRVSIKYTTGQTQEYLPNKTVSMPLNKKLFNNSKGFNYYMISTDTKDLITGKNLEFKVSFGSSPAFYAGDKIEFDVVIKDNKLRSANDAVLQTGHFKLTRKEGT